MFFDTAPENMNTVDYLVYTTNIAKNKFVELGGMD